MISVRLRWTTSRFASAGVKSSEPVHPAERRQLLGQVDPVIEKHLTGDPLGLGARHPHRDHYAAGRALARVPELRSARRPPRSSSVTDLFRSLVSPARPPEAILSSNRPRRGNLLTPDGGMLVPHGAIDRGDRASARELADRTVRLGRAPEMRRRREEANQVVVTAVGRCRAREARRPGKRLPKTPIGPCAPSTAPAFPWFSV